MIDNVSKIKLKNALYNRNRDSLANIYSKVETNGTTNLVHISHNGLMINNIDNLNYNSNYHNNIDSETTQKLLDSLKNKKTNISEHSLINKQLPMTENNNHGIIDIGHQNSKSDRRILNLSSHPLNNLEYEVLKKGLNFSLLQNPFPLKKLSVALRMVFSLSLRKKNIALDKIA